MAQHIISSPSQLMPELPCIYCKAPNQPLQWPQNGNEGHRRYQRGPGPYYVEVVCDKCNKKWYVMWHDYPGTGCIVRPPPAQILVIGRNKAPDDDEVPYEVESLITNVLLTKEQAAKCNVVTGYVDCEDDFESFKMCVYEQILPIAHLSGEFDILFWNRSGDFRADIVAYEDEQKSQPKPAHSKSGCGSAALIMVLMAGACVATWIARA